MRRGSTCCCRFSAMTRSAWRPGSLGSAAVGAHSLMSLSMPACQERGCIMVSMISEPQHRALRKSIVVFRWCNPCQSAGQGYQARSQQTALLTCSQADTVVVSLGHICRISDTP